MLIDEHGSNVRSRLLRGGVYVVLLIWLVALLFPLYWTLITITKNRIDATTPPPTFVPEINKTAHVILDYTGYVKAHSGISQALLDQKVSQDTAVVVGRLMYNSARLVSVHVRAVAGKQTILHQTFSWVRIYDHESQFLTQAPSVDRFQAHLLMHLFHVTFRPVTLTGALTSQVSLPTAGPGKLAPRLLEHLKTYHLAGTPSITVENASIIHWLDPFHEAYSGYPLFAINAASPTRWFLNTVIYVVGIIVTQVTFSALAAYALSYLFGRQTSRLMLIFYLATLALPAFMIFIPMYLQMRFFPFRTIPFTSLQLPTKDLLNSYLALIIPNTAWAFSIILFKGFFDGLPEGLIEAARIDGANEWHIFTRLVVPLSKPIVATLCVFTYTATWGEFLWPYLVETKHRMWTLSVGLYYAAGTAEGGVSDIREPLALGLMMAIPTLFVFVFLQRYMLRSITFSGLKG